VPDAVRREVLGIMLDTRPTGVEQMIRAFAVADLRPALPALRVPTLLLHGELDARSPRSVAEDLRGRIPGARLRLVRGAGHMANVEAPEEFNREARRFLRSVQG
jgi:pimeloyl-ACP methyl ester carboxylesterase